MTKYPVFYPDVPSFIHSLQKRHDSLLEDVDTSEPEGAALRVRLPARVESPHHAAVPQIASTDLPTQCVLPAMHVHQTSACSGPLQGSMCHTPHASQLLHLPICSGAPF